MFLQFFMLFFQTFRKKNIFYSSPSFLYITSLVVAVIGLNNSWEPSAKSTWDSCLSCNFCLTESRSGRNCLSAYSHSLANLDVDDSIAGAILLRYNNNNLITQT